MKEFALAALIALLILVLGVIGLAALGMRMLLEVVRGWMPTQVGEEEVSDRMPMDEDRE